MEIDNWCGSRILTKENLRFSTLMDKCISIKIENELNFQEQIQFNSTSICYDAWNYKDPNFSIILDNRAGTIQYCDLEQIFLKELIFRKSNNSWKNHIIFNKIYEKYYDKIILV